MQSQYFEDKDDLTHDHSQMCYDEPSHIQQEGDCEYGSENYVGSQGENIDYQDDFQEGNHPEDGYYNHPEGERIHEGENYIDEYHEGEFLDDANY